MMDALGVDAREADLHLVYGAAKNRMALIAQALVAIGVAVRVIADFDVLRDEHDMRGIVEALGGDWTQFAKDWKCVTSAIQTKRPELRTSDVKREIEAVLEQERQSNLSSSAVTKIQAVLKRTSAWSEAKGVGRQYIPSGDASIAYARLASALRTLGLFIVEVGELEGYCRTVSLHGPAWVAGVLGRDLKTDPELEDARVFARAIATGWSGDALR